jgi:hypothetical protein
MLLKGSHHTAVPTPLVCSPSHFTRMSKPSVELRKISSLGVGRCYHVFLVNSSQPQPEGPSVWRWGMLKGSHHTAVPMHGCVALMARRSIRVGARKISWVNRERRTSIPPEKPC